MVRTTITKTVAKDEVATIFSVMLLLGELLPYATNTLVKKVYNSTLDSFPAAFFLVCAVFNAVAAAINLALFSVRGQIDRNAELMEEEEEQQRIKVEEGAGAKAREDDNGEIEL